MSKKGVCDKHSKDLEIFCYECNGVTEPFCSLCICEHYKTKHNKDMKHVTNLIDDKLKQIAENCQNTAGLQEKLKLYDIQAQNNQITKDDLKAKHDEKLLRLKNLFKEQESLASANHAEILRCHEKTYKEIRKCESKLKDNINEPQKISKKVKDLTSQQRYWEGYEEVKRAIEDSKKLDDEDIKKNLNEYTKLLEEHKNLLAALDMAPAHSSEFRLIKQENEELKSKFKGYIE